MALGLFVDGATNGTIIRNNVIEDTGEGAQKTGIRLGREVGEVELENNTIKAVVRILDEREKK